MNNCKRFITTLCAALLLINLQTFATFSITAVDTVTKEVGSAGASCIAGSIMLSDVFPGKGIVHTQASYTQTNQSRARGYFNQGDSPADIISKTNNRDSNPRVRQYGVVRLDYIGKSAAYSGSGCQNYKGHIIGRNYTIQGNILDGRFILDSMETRFLNTPGNLSDKMMAALQGAKKPGADTRCRRYNKSTISAFIRMARPNDPSTDFYLDLNVNNTSGSTDPIDRLQDKYDDWTATNIKNRNQKISFKIVVNQNHPNPFSNVTNIQYTLLKPAKVSLAVFNTSGRKIRSLVNKSQEPGKYEVSWDGTDQYGKSAVGGVYMYMIRLGSEVQTYRMLLVR